MKRYQLILAILLVLISGIVPAFAQEEESENVYTVTFSDEGVDVPTDIPTGLVNFTFDNSKTEAPVVLDLMRLNADVSEESFLETMQASEDPTAALALVTLYGGTQINPASSVNISYELEAGIYVLVDFAGGLPAFFTVLGDEATAEPMEEMTPEATSEADGMVHVELDDFFFIAPDEIAAGENVWEIRNVGEQWHEMAIYQLTDENLTEQDVVNFLFESAMAEEEMSLEGLEPFGVWLPMDAGQSAWVTWDLPAGRYVLACFLPDLTNMEEMHSHLELGMIRFLNVAGE
jgi:hypothetical protein